MPGGRPVVEFDKKLFSDLVGLGCSEEEICWVFRDENTGKVANVDTLSRWCKRTYGLSFQEYTRKNKLMLMKTQLRKNQLQLSKKSAAMAIWLGKQYLGQSEQPIKGEFELSTREDELSKSLKELAQELESDE